MPTTQPKVLKPTKKVARKVLALVDKGLTHGLGKQVEGEMCVEAAVCYAFGLPHGDNPPCVGPAVRSFKIKLNDSRWSSNQERAKGLRRLAIAQLGSDKIGQELFQQELLVGLVKQILPIAFRAAAKMLPQHAQTYETLSLACETAIDFASAKLLAMKAKAETAGIRAADAAANASTAAAYASTAAAATAAAYASTAAAYASTAAAATAAAYASTAAAATAAADAAARNSVLSKMAEIGVQALIKLGAQGAKWLDLCPEAV